MSNVTKLPVDAARAGKLITMSVEQLALRLAEAEEVGFMLAMVEMGVKPLERWKKRQHLETMRDIRAAAYAFRIRNPSIADER
jgi:hypothetical protein